MNQVPVRSKGAGGRSFARFAGASALNQLLERQTDALMTEQAATVDPARRREIFIDVQRILASGERAYGITSRLIMCFLRHLSAESAFATLGQALPYREQITAVGLDSYEIGHPPAQFVDVFERARQHGFRAVAHAGEEGPAEYIWQALNLLHVARIDHGIQCMKDAALVRELVSRQVPLTVCPLSNVKLGVFARLEEHNLRQMLERDGVVYEGYTRVRPTVFTPHPKFDTVLK